MSRLAQLKEQGVDETNLKGGMTPQGLKELSIDKLVEDPKNERKTFNNMDGLIATISKMGVVEPLTVIPIRDGKFQIVTGHRRYRASKAAGLTHVKVVISQAEDASALRKKSIISNVQREDVPPLEMAHALQEILDTDETITKQRELSELIGKSEAWVSSLLRILDLPPALQEKLSTSKVPLSYDSVGRVARLKILEQQEQLVNDLINGATVVDIRQKAPGSRKKKTDSPKPKKVINTSQGISVILQSKNGDLTKANMRKALEEALEVINV